MVVLRSCFFGVGLVWVCVCDLCLCLGCSFVGFWLFVWFILFLLFVICLCLLVVVFAL